MKKRPLVRFLSATLTTIYIATNCAFAHKPEATMWDERRGAVKNSGPTQLAQIPVNLASRNISSVLHQLPSVEPSLPHQLEKSISKQAASQLVPVFKSLSGAHGSIQKILTPKNSRPGRIVIHVQDVHRNAEAQQNISKAIQSLIDNNVADMIALEGAFAPIDISPFRAYPLEATKKVANYLLRENRISGPIYAAFTSPKPIPRIVGIDDTVHYNANVEAYRQSISSLAEYKRQLNDLRTKLDDEKRKEFSRLLYDFDRQAQSYVDGNLPLGQYVERLSQQTSTPPLNVEIFLEAYRLESRLNFASVEAERGRLLSALLEKLSTSESQKLVAASMAYRLGNISHTDFYTRLKNLCAQNGIALSHFPAMNSYLQYVLLTDRIDAETLFRDIKTMESSAYSLLAKTEAEKRIVTESTQLSLTRKLLDFSLTKDEWSAYKEIKKGDLAFDLSTFESFYIEAEQRDRAMSENLLKAVTQSNAKVAVLVTGGFHSDGIDRQLMESGYMVVSFTPKMTKVDSENGSAYLSIFAQEKTPLDRLFEGEKLFLSEAPIPKGTQTIEALQKLAVEADGRAGLFETNYTRGTFGVLFGEDGEVAEVEFKQHIGAWLAENGLVEKIGDGFQQIGANCAEIAKAIAARYGFDIEALTETIKQAGSIENVKRVLSKATPFAPFNLVIRANPADPSRVHVTVSIYGIELNFGAGNAEGFVELHRVDLRSKSASLSIHKNSPAWTIGADVPSKGKRPGGGKDEIANLLERLNTAKTRDEREWVADLLLGEYESEGIQSEKKGRILDALVARASRFPADLLRRILDLAREQLLDELTKSLADVEEDPTKSWLEYLCDSNGILKLWGKRKDIELSLRSIVTHTTDYNRDQVFRAIFSDRLPELRKNGIDVVVYLQFCARILAQEKRLGYQIIEGVSDGLMEKTVDIGLPLDEQDRIFSFVSKFNSFEPILFNLYKRDETILLAPLFEFAQRILIDDVSPERADQLVSFYNEKGMDGNAILAAAIQMVIPSSGASFVGKSEIAGLLQEFRESKGTSDPRDDVPLLLRDIDFGGKAKDALTLKVWSLKAGETYDPDDAISNMLQSLRHKDFGSQNKARVIAADKGKLTKALLNYFSNPNSDSSGKALRAFFSFASHNDLLGEKIDRINPREFQGLQLLEQLFVDKDALASILKDVLEKMDQNVFPKVSMQTNRPIANPGSLARQLQGVWGSGQPDKKDRVGKILNEISAKDIEDKVLPLITNKLLTASIKKIVKEGRPARPMQPLEIIEQLFKEPLAFIQREKTKFQVDDLSSKMTLSFRVVKGVPFSLWGINCGVCIATDVDLWKDPHFFLLAMIDPNSKTVVGFAHLYEQVIEGKKVLTVPGIEPGVEFLSEVNPKDVYPLIEKALVEIAQTGGYDALYFPVSENILSNRPDIAKIIQKRFHNKKITLSEEIDWNHEPQPYPFSTVYEVWEKNDVTPRDPAQAISTKVFWRALFGNAKYGETFFTVAWEGFRLSLLWIILFSLDLTISSQFWNALFVLQLFNYAVFLSPLEHKIVSRQQAGVLALFTVGYFISSLFPVFSPLFFVAILAILIIHYAHDSGMLRKFLRTRWERRSDVLKPSWKEHWKVLNPVWIVDSHEPKTISDWVQLGMGYVLLLSFIHLFNTGLVYLLASTTSLDFSKIEHLADALSFAVGVFPAHMTVNVIAVLLGWKALSEPKNKEDSKKRFIEGIEIGDQFVYPPMGLVTVVSLDTDGKSVFFKEGAITSQVALKAEGRRSKVEVNAANFFLYKKSGKKKIYSEGLEAIRQRAIKRVPELYIAIYFGLMGIDNRLRSGNPNIDKNSYQEAFCDTWEEVFDETTRINQALVTIATKLDRQQLDEKLITFLRKYFLKIYFETGEDLVLTGAMNSYGESFKSGQSEKFKYFVNYRRNFNLFGDRGFVPKDVHDYFMDWVIRTGLRGINKAGGKETITDEEYRKIHDQYFYFLAPYFSKKDPRHQTDDFSKLILRQKKDFSVTDDIASLVNDRLDQLSSSPFSEVDLIVPAPAINALTNQTIPLAQFVAQKLQRPLSLTAIRQIRKRKSQKKLSTMQRRAFNAGGVFDGTADELEGKTILIVDDNETSGFTGAAMMVAAYEAGAKKVLLLSYGRSFKKNQPETLPPSPSKPEKNFTFSLENLVALILGSDVSSRAKVAAINSLPVEHLYSSILTAFWEILSDEEKSPGLQSVIRIHLGRALGFGSSRGMSAATIRNVPLFMDFMRSKGIIDASSALLEQTRMLKAYKFAEKRMKRIRESVNNPQEPGPSDSAQAISTKSLWHFFFDDAKYGQTLFTVAWEAFRLSVLWIILFSPDLTISSQLWNALFMLQLFNYAVFLSPLEHYITTRGQFGVLILLTLGYPSSILLVALVNPWFLVAIISLLLIHYRHDIERINPLLSKASLNTVFDFNQDQKRVVFLLAIFLTYVMTPSLLIWGPKARVNGVQSFHNANLKDWQEIPEPPRRRGRINIDGADSSHSFSGSLNDLPPPSIIGHEIYAMDIHAIKEIKQYEYGPPTAVIREVMMPLIPVEDIYIYPFPKPRKEEEGEKTVVEREEIPAPLPPTIELGQGFVQTPARSFIEGAEITHDLFLEDNPFLSIAVVTSSEGLPLRLFIKKIEGHEDLIISKAVSFGAATSVKLTYIHHPADPEYRVLVVVARLLSGNTMKYTVTLNHEEKTLMLHRQGGDFNGRPSSSFERRMSRTSQSVTPSLHKNNSDLNDSAQATLTRFVSAFAAFFIAHGLPTVHGSARPITPDVSQSGYLLNELLGPVQNIGVGSLKQNLNAFKSEIKES
ncbi:MAG: hypothetical protein ACKVQC_00535, partial [Elusimicrobiota bacterium]